MAAKGRTKKDTEMEVENLENGTVTETKPQKELEDSDEIQVKSLLPHVSYLDKDTGDTYEWENVGDVNGMTVKTLKSMWRNHKGYFRNLWLKPLDERVVQKFGLSKLYDEYAFIMDRKSYTKANLGKLGEIIGKAPTELKYTILNKVKNFVGDGGITDITVLRALGNKLDADFVNM